MFEVKNFDNWIEDIETGKYGSMSYNILENKYDTFCMTMVHCDYSRNAIENIKKNFPEVEKTECFDMSKGLPFGDNLTDTIISDLSLHYFSEQKTFEILDEIKRVLKPNGLLFFRVNSVKDVNHGGGEGKEIETYFYETDDGRYK